MVIGRIRKSWLHVASKNKKGAFSSSLTILVHYEIYAAKD